MNRVFAALFVLHFVQLGAFAEDQWTVSNPPAPISKWCEENGSKVRYADHVVPGYKLCGEIATSRLCDSSGRRFISQGAAAPSYTYRDCGVGQRIQIKTDGAAASSSTGELSSDPNVIDYQDFRTGEKKPEMSKTEKAQLQKKIKEIDQTQKKQFAQDLQDTMKQLLSGLNGGGQSKELDEVMKQMQLP
jgi:hypothetical protein